jgi:stage 0 sporulation protein B (sporulation initiation phosphotransferase)
MKKSWSTVELLSHSRHDWLNHLQLIKGHIALNNHEKVNAIIDEIALRSKHEANLSNVNANKLAHLLLTANWEKYNFKMDFEVISDMSPLTAFDEELAHWFENFFKVLNDTAVAGEENHVMLTLQLLKDKKKILVDFSGKMNNSNELKIFFKQKLYESLEIVDLFIQREEFVFTLRLNEVK